MPRHPPHALNNLHTTHKTQLHAQRCSHPLCNSQTPTRNTHHTNHLNPTQTLGTVWSRRAPDLFLLQKPHTHNARVVSGPNSVPTVLVNSVCCSSYETRLNKSRPGVLQRHPGDHHRPLMLSGTIWVWWSWCLLLRKEVIQPHLPVRLPCYDFVPIASPTFDHSPPHGLGHGLRVLPTFVT
jgi:hypothetical protein